MKPNEEKPTDAATRRQFLKRAASGASVVFVVITERALAGRSGRAQDAKDQPKQNGGSQAQAAAPEEPSTLEHYDPHEHEYVFLFDINKCIGCGACVRACERENGVPKDYFRTWVERYRVSRSGHVEIDSPNGARDGFHATVTDRTISKGFFVPKVCNHCTATPCVQLCPVGASYRSPDGLILVDEKRCIGCSYCVQACPYGSRFIDPETHVASKCTFCYHRITKGVPPACVQACPVGARRYGDRKRPADPVAEAIATKQIGLLKPELHTQPNCYYLGLTTEVR